MARAASPGPWWFTDQVANRLRSSETPLPPFSGMAAAVGLEQADFSEVTSTPGHKRKRATESASPESRRKRGVPVPAAMTVTEDAAQAFLDETVGIAQAAQDHVNVEDFTALQQATVDPHSVADAATASSTAAAALNMYPTLHVPPTTEETFAAQVGADAHHDDGSFNTSVNQPDGLPMPPPSSMQPQNGVPPDTNYRPHNPKPAVGSEEWHKMRKDNHKEGLFFRVHRL